MYEIIFKDIVGYEGIMDLGSVQNSIRETRRAEGFTFVRLAEVN